MSAKVREDEISAKWPLHWLVWRDDHKALKRLLRDEETQVCPSLPVSSLGCVSVPV